MVVGSSPLQQMYSTTLGLLFEAGQIQTAKEITIYLSRELLTTEII